MFREAKRAEAGDIGDGARLMGLYDHVRVLAPVPDIEAQGLTFQTKAFDCVLDDFTITADGRLIHHTTRWEETPEEERPFWGKPEWKEDSFYTLIGMLRRIPTGDVEISHHGDVWLIASVGDWNMPDCKWFDYVARFTNGRLEHIRRSGEDAGLPMEGE